MWCNLPCRYPWNPSWQESIALLLPLDMWNEEAKGTFAPGGERPRPAPAVWDSTRHVWLLPGPLTTRLYFLPYSNVDRAWKKHFFFFSFFLLISGVTATQLGAGTGVCEQAASPSPHTHTRLGLSLPSPPPHRAPGRLWTARADLGCGSQGSELALAGIARMSDYVCLCLCNVWNFPPPVSIPRTLAGFFGSLGRVVFHTAQRTHSIYPINYIAMLQVKAALCISIWGIRTGKMLCRGACICAGWRHCLECPSALVPGTRVAWWD